MNTPHLATDMTELLRALYDDAKVERFLTAASSEGITVEFSPGHAFNIVITRARQVNPRARREPTKPVDAAREKADAARATAYAARRARMEMAK